jgi:hypothetical protein
MISSDLRKDVCVLFGLNKQVIAHKLVCGCYAAYGAQILLQHASCFNPRLKFVDE